MAEPEDTKQVEVESGPLREVSFQIKIQEADSFAYSNVASISMSPWDLRVNFADVNPKLDEPEGTTKAFAGIIMPPEHAASLALLLMDQLHRYEQQFGLIREPKWRAMATAAKQRLKEATKGGTEPK